jgi:hypothetical protein
MHYVECMACHVPCVVRGAITYIMSTWLALNPTWFRAPCNSHHAMNHVGFMISPELYIVQDRVHG